MVASKCRDAVPQVSRLLRLRHSHVRGTTHSDLWVVLAASGTAQMHRSRRSSGQRLISGPAGRSSAQQRRIDLASAFDHWKIRGFKSGREAQPPAGNNHRQIGDQHVLITLLTVGEAGRELSGR